MADKGYITEVYLKSEKAMGKTCKKRMNKQKEGK